MLPYMSVDTLSPTSHGIVFSIVFGAFFILYWASPPRRFPLVNGKQFLEFRDIHAKKRFVTGARGLIKFGLSKWPVFNILSENGYKTVLSPKYSDDIRSHEELSFGMAVAAEFHSQIPGFEPFKEGGNSDEIFQDAVRMKLTRSLGHLTQPLSDETSCALQKSWTDDPEWRTIPLKATILAIVAQLSSKVFLGDRICRNPEWLKITINYTVDSFLAAESLRLWPRLLRPWVAPFLPSCQKLRAHIQKAREIIDPVLDERKREKLETIRKGLPPQKYNDAMEWMEECAKGRPYDPAIAQLSFSLAAIHTTSDMITQLLFDICEQEELIQALREEAVSVISQEGWQKTTLYKLKLMDSTMKESQRLKPTNITSMRRIAKKDLTLSDGTFLPKGTSLLVSSQNMWDPNIYTDPELFDPYRFLKMRETPGHETAAQFVSPSPDHMGFGLGKHACPGRFFASNEIKILFCHMLLKYDFKMAPGSTPQHRIRGTSLNSDPFASLMIRRRKEEIEL